MIEFNHKRVDTLRKEETDMAAMAKPNEANIIRDKTACIVLVTMLEYRSCVMKNPGFMPVLIYKYICKEVKKNA